MVYALIALGYTMVYGVIGLINFAHGEVFMAGSFMALTAIWILGAVLPGAPFALKFIFLILFAMAGSCFLGALWCGRFGIGL